MKVPLRKAFRVRSNYWLAVISEVFSPLIRFLADVKVRRGKKSRDAWENVLLLGANHIGDILYRTCSLKELAEGMPNCRFDIIAPPPADGVLERNPYVAKIHRFETPFESRGRDFEILKKERYDAVICYDSGSYLPCLRLAIDLQIPHRVGYVHKGFSGLVTYPIEIKYPQAYPKYFQDFVSQLTKRVSGKTLSPEAFPEEADQLEADEIIREYKLHGAEIVAAFLTSRQPLGVFPAEKLAIILKEVEEREPNIHTVLLGAASDAPLLERVKKDYSLRAKVIAGRMPLLALICFLKRCRLVLSTDSGPRHLANVARIPVYFYRNINFDAAEAGPYSEGDHDLMPKEYSNVSQAEQWDVFNRISTHEAAEIILDKLKNNSGELTL